VFNAAAFTNVDLAEDQGDAAFRANAIGPEILARACSARGIKLIHYSTDFVFEGTLARLYDEFDRTSPQGVYARSKVAGEELARAACRELFILRVGCLYGRGGRNFPSTVARRLLAGETIKADRDRRGSPSWVRDVARVSSKLAQTEHYGLYHCTSSGETSWAGYARFIASELGVPEDRVVELSTEALPMKAPRPPRAILDNRMLRLRGLDEMPDWREAARAFLQVEVGATTEKKTEKRPGS
jgi:dTDP-4-dehydrorhamnose reductase